MRLACQILFASFKFVIRLYLLHGFNFNLCSCFQLQCFNYEYRTYLCFLQSFRNSSIYCVALQQFNNNSLRDPVFVVLTFAI